VNPEIITTGVPTTQLSHESPLERPMKKSACFSKRARSCSDLSPVSSVRDGIPDQPLTVRRSLIDADDAISRLLDERYNVPPPNRIVPILAPCGALHCDANVWVRDRARLVEIIGNIK
jgi:hypothetical protein